MKIVVIGGTGHIGSKVVRNLSELGHEAVAAAPNTGVNTLTGEGLSAALVDATVVVDVSNSPSFEDKAVLEFFRTSTKNLLEYGKEAGVQHLVALSVVGTQSLDESGYFRAKIAQEALIASGGIPFSIVHATQFFEFVKSIAAAGTTGNEVHLAPVASQPMASDDVATAVGRVAVGPAIDRIIEIAGPDRFRLDEFIRKGLKVIDDPRVVIADKSAKYFGASLNDATLVPSPGAELGQTRFDDWLGGGNLQK